MDYFEDLNFGQHDVQIQSQQCTIEIQIKVTFEENFPFKELEELVSIVEKSDDLERLHLLPNAIKVAKKMKLKFSNSLGLDYETWVLKVNNAIATLNQFWNELRSAVSIPDSIPENSAETV